MHYKFTIYGINCNNCIKKITELLENKLETKNLKFINDNSRIELDSNLLATIGSYKVDYIEDNQQNEYISKKTSYKPIVLIFMYLIMVNILIAMHEASLKGVMTNFMASFFLVFSFFKLLDIKGFASSYSSYDLIAKKIRYYGYVYPFVELAFGIGYILDGSIIYLNLVVFIVMLVSSIGVIKAKLTKEIFSCACVGTFLNVPLGSVAIIEDTMMVIMSLFMILELL